ncbi:Dbl homology domain-containing protein [Entophlyctis helioformis]|nr:Dbl homology domain-containing protein [Entophlyctis helioformis]
MPRLSSATALRGPLFTPEATMSLYPHLLDAIVGSLPPDAWDWISTEADLATIRDEQYDEPTPIEEVKPTIESVLTKDKRGYVVMNLWETEQSYVSQLGVIQKVFRQRLLERGIINETISNLIFAGVEELHMFHVRFMESLQQVVSVDSWSTTESRIGALFVAQKAELIKLYTRFIDNYAISQKSMKQAEKNSEEYQAFMKEMVKLRETNRQSLKDLLILPVQRTTRYHLLLRDLLKCTPAEHPDHEDLEQAWEAMNQLAAMVNEKKRREEEATGLFDAFESTKHCPPTLISHQRRLIMRVEATDKSSKRDIQLVLCSDLLMVTIPARSGVFSRSGTDYAYRFVRWLDILELDVTDLATLETGAVKDCLRITLNPAKRPPELPSQSTPAHDISPSVPKELAAPVLVVQFSGQDAGKNRAGFFLAIQAEMKVRRDACEKERAKAAANAAKADQARADRDA